jgi:hypothetical protein
VGATTSGFGLVNVAVAVVTVTVPVVAVAGTVAVIFVLETTVYFAATPLNLTALTLVKPVPVTTAWLPAFSTVGATEVIDPADAASAGGLTTVQPRIASSRVDPAATSRFDTPRCATMTSPDHRHPAWLKVIVTEPRVAARP